MQLSEKIIINQACALFRFVIDVLDVVNTTLLMNAYLNICSENLHFVQYNIVT
jgi:hypothetical protein